jgi:hypothetical protein
MEEMSMVAMVTTEKEKDTSNSVSMYKAFAATRRIY